MIAFWLCLAAINVFVMATYLVDALDMTPNNVLGFVLNMLSFWLAIIALVDSAP